MASLSDIFPMIEDIQDDYRLFRQKGESREEACQHILDDNQKELADEDDGPQVWIGLAKVTGARGEMTEELFERAEQAFQQISENWAELREDHEYAKIVQHAHDRICDRSKIGEQAKYPKKRIYKPDWEIGDTFICELEDFETDELQGKVVLVRKIAEDQHPHGDWEQIVYLTICDRDHLPTNSEEMNKLGIIPSKDCTRRNDITKTYEYKWHLWTSSLRRQKQYKLTKIGCFPDILKPDNEIDPSPLWMSFLILPGTINSYAAGWYKRYGVMHKAEKKTQLGTSSSSILR